MKAKKIDQAVTEEHKELIYEKDSDIFESFDEARPDSRIEEDYIFDEDKKKDVEVQYERKFKYWLSGYAMSRVLSNQNYILIFTGGTGSGKSYTAMEMAMDLDPDFNVERIVFKPEDFITVTKQKLPKGSVIMWDEVGVGLSAREWFSIQNRMISYVLETFRRDNLILIMTTPNISFIDKKVRSLLHGYAETVEKTFTGGRFGFVKYFHIVVSQREGKTMYRYPRIRDSTGRTRVVKGKSSVSGNMKFGKPPEELTIEYEKKKYEFTESLKDEAFEMITGTGEKVKTKFDVQDLIEFFLKDPNKYGLLEDDATMTDIVNTAYVELKLEHADMKFSKSDIDASIRYVLKKGLNMQLPDGRKEEFLDDSMFNTVKRLHVKVKDYRKVAKTLDLDKEIVKRSIRSWKERGLWDDSQSSS